MKWKLNDGACGYNIYFGTEPGKLYNSVMVLGANEYWFKVMDKTIPYYFSIEAFNENGTSGLSQIVKAE